MHGQEILLGTLRVLQDLNTSGDSKQETPPSKKRKKKKKCFQFFLYILVHELRVFILVHFMLYICCSKFQCFSFSSRIVYFQIFANPSVLFFDGTSSIYLYQCICRKCLISIHNEYSVNGCSSQKIVFKSIQIQTNVVKNIKCLNSLPFTS